MSILDALQEYDRKVESMIQNLRNDRDLLAKENLQLHSQLSKTTALLSRRTLGIGLLLAKLQKTMSMKEIDELTMGNLDLTSRAEAVDPIGQLYRRKKGKNFWSDNQDGGLPQKKLEEYQFLTSKLSVTLRIPCHDGDGFSRELARRIRTGEVKESREVVRWLALHSAVFAETRAESPPNSGSTDTQEEAARAAFSIFRVPVGPSRCRVGVHVAR